MFGCFSYLTLFRSVIRYVYREAVCHGGSSGMVLPLAVIDGQSLSLDPRVIRRENLRYAGKGLEITEAQKNWLVGLFTNQGNIMGIIVAYQIPRTLRTKEEIEAEQEETTRLRDIYNKQNPA